MQRADLPGAREIPADQLEEPPQAFGAVRLQRQDRGQLGHLAALGSDPAGGGDGVLGHLLKLRVAEPLADKEDKLMM
ncbi:hypothetical protein GCM10010302_00600 [Streptomyces polychromogenes]|uniref:Uncharacterized protein n=1 Tax=Streptomyces polychromogenes TaxID=67342 RepID=A0ABN0UZ48_9ACTN